MTHLSKGMEQHKQHENHNVANQCVFERHFYFLSFVRLELACWALISKAVGSIR